MQRIPGSKFRLAPCCKPEEIQQNNPKVILNGKERGNSCQIYTPVVPRLNKRAADFMEIIPDKFQLIPAVHQGKLEVK